MEFDNLVVEDYKSDEWEILRPSVIMLIWFDNGWIECTRDAGWFDEISWLPTIA